MREVLDENGEQSIHDLAHLPARVHALRRCRAYRSCVPPHTHVNLATALPPTSERCGRRAREALGRNRTHSDAMTVDRMDKDETMWNQHALARCAVLGLGAFGMTLLFAVGPAPAATVGAAPPAGAAAPPVPFASRDAAAGVEPSAPNAWGGARTGNEPTLSDRVVGYAIQATLDPVKPTVDGHETLTWRNRSDRAIDAVYLHLYLNAFEGNGSTFFTERNRPGFEFRSGVKIEDGQWGHIELRKVEQGGTSARVSFVHPDGGPPTDHTV